MTLSRGKVVEINGNGEGQVRRVDGPHLSLRLADQQPPALNPDASLTILDASSRSVQVPRPGDKLLFVPYYDGKKLLAKPWCFAQDWDALERERQRLPANRVYRVMRHQIMRFVSQRCGETIFQGSFRQLCAQGQRTNDLRDPFNPRRFHADYDVVCSFDRWEGDQWVSCADPRPLHRA